MQVYKINSNYGYKTNIQPSFKGIGQQKIFHDMVNTSNLKRLLKDSKEFNVDTAQRYFINIFNKLKTKFGENYKIKTRENSMHSLFNFKNGKEIIEIEVGKYNGFPCIKYEEKKPFTKPVELIEEAYYRYFSYEKPDQQGIVHSFQRKKSMTMKIPKNPGESVSTMEILHQADKNFKPYSFNGENLKILL